MPFRFTTLGSHLALWLLATGPASTLSAAVPVADIALEPLEVEATYSRISPAAAPGSITVITREQIEESAARHVSEVLRGQGGVQLSDLFGDGSRTTVSMRGFGENAPANTLILIDGRRLNNVDLAAPDLDGIALKDVERIEIVQGSAGIVYGDQAVGGVINIITRRPAAFALDTQATAGSYNTALLDLDVSDRFANGFEYRLSGQGGTTDNYRDNNDRDLRRLLARVGFNHRSGNIFAEYQRYTEDLNTPGALFASEVAEDRRQARFPNDFNDTDSDVARVGVFQTLGEFWELDADYTYRSNDVDGTLSDLPFQQDRTLHAFTPRLHAGFMLPGGEVLLTLGSEILDSDYDFESPFGATSNNQRQRSLYARGVIPVLAPITLTLGVRAADVDNDLTDTLAFPQGVNLDDDVTVTELGLAWTPTDTWRLFARREENYRFAKVDEQTFTLPDVVGLDTQTGTSYESGVEWSGRVASIKALLYRLKLDNEIAFDPSAGAFGANVNLAATQRNGLILEARYQATAAITLSAEYSYVDAEFDRGVFADNRIPMVAEHTARGVINYRPTGHWHLFGEVQAITDRFPAGDFANDLQELDGYVVFNASITYRGKSWSMAGRVNNITDKEYSDFAVKDFTPSFEAATAFYPSPERNFTVDFRYAFN